MIKMFEKVSRGTPLMRAQRIAEIAKQDELVMALLRQAHSETARGFKVPWYQIRLADFRDPRPAFQELLVALEESNTAKVALALTELSASSIAMAQIGERVVLRKGLIEGVGTKSLVPYGILEAPFAVQLARDYHKWADGLIVEDKYDGFRCIAIVRDGKVELRSRTGKPLDAPAVAAELAALENVVLDGELMVGMFGSRDRDAKFVAYDALTLHEWDTQTCTRTQKQRRARLEELVIPSSTVSLSKTYNVRSEEELFEILANVVAAGGEGLIVKEPSAPYSWKRTAAWQKLKPLRTVDAKVVRVLKGEGRLHNTMGALEVVVGAGPVVRVGTGFTDHDRDLIWTLAHKVIGATMEVGYLEKTPEGSLRHPRFMGWKGDSPVA